MSRLTHPMHSLIRTALALATLAWIATGAPQAAHAQSLFEPAIKVNDNVITRYELEQRARMLQIFDSPGNPEEAARDQLIEDRLKVDAARDAGLRPSREEIEEGMEEFAGRAEMSAEELIDALDGAGVAEETFRDFIIVGLSWRELVRARFASRVEVSEREVERALGQSGAGNVRVLLSEIILPAESGQEAAAEARARELAQITSTEAFSEAARRHSAAESRERGGRLDWQSASELPPAIQSRVLGLGRGQVTEPIPIPGGIALLQMRGIEEGAVAEPEYAAIEYAAYYIDGGRSDQALARARNIEESIDTCDDLYGIAKDEPEDVLERDSKSPEEIPADVAAELAGLDRHEVSTALTRADGETLVFLMLCGRTPVTDEDISREDVMLSLQNRRLESFANGYLEQLRAEARIIDQ
ncbi:peptidylprolyl isomerase [Aquicoccus sp.]|uniref:peptidylprolyl isomerase n=1 Tax=Aquicoccus sp. TaxID=2055851 RepID=UPI0035665FCF